MDPFDCAEGGGTESANNVQESAPSNPIEPLTQFGKRCRN